MTLNIQCGYDANGAFFANIDGGDLSQIAQAPNDLHSELVRRLNTGPANVTPGDPTPQTTSIASAPQAEPEPSEENTEP